MKPIKVKVEQANVLTGRQEDTLLWPADLHEQLVERTQTLFSKYEVKPGDWQALAMMLAFRHEPDFQIELDDGRRRGRRTKPIKWGMLRLFFLWLDVEDYKRSHKGSTDESACFKLWKADQCWGVSAGFEDDDTLGRKYRDAKKSPLVQSMSGVIAALGRDTFEASIAGLRQNRLSMLADEHLALNGSTPD